MQKILFTMIACGVAAAVGWAIIEPFSPGLGVGFERWQVLYSLIVGGAIGGALGAISGYAQGSRAHFLRSALLGTLVGAAGGYFGLQLGGTIADAIFPGIFENQQPPQIIIARTIVFVPFGACIGLAYGLGAKSGTRALQGAFGGAIGGAVGGFLFDIVGSQFSNLVLSLQQMQMGETGQIPRAIASVMVGSSIGLFAGIVEAASKRAWVRLEVARNEGREWIVDAPRTLIGRSETAHIPLFGDPNLFPMHACIAREHGVYRLLDGGSPIGIGVNGIRVPDAVLRHGDIINVGSFQLRFYLRRPDSTAPVLRAPLEQQTAEPVVSPVPPPAPMRSREISIVALDGPLSGRRFVLDSTERIAGRESDWLNLSFDPQASRRHAALTAQAAGVHVRDLGSTNGTIANGVRVQEMILRGGDTLQIGATSFRVET